MRVPAAILRFVKWTLVGSLGLCIKTGTLALAHEALGIHYLFATVVAVEVALLHNFCWHQCWTWHDRPAHGKAITIRLLRFHTSAAILAMAVNLAFMRLLVGGLALHYVPASLLCGPLVGLANFLVAEFFIFVRPMCSPRAEQPAFFRT